MHIFDYSFLKDDLLPAQLINLTSNIYALRVMSDIRKKENDTAFKELEALAKIESVKASNAIEGIISTDARIREIVQNRSAPLNHTEAEIAGYRDVLNEIHQHPEMYDFNERDIKRFHAMMMRLADPEADGAYKTEDNVIAERMPDGRRVVRFTPTSAADTPDEMQQLVLAYQEARDDNSINKLLLIPCVILDFLCIHPFNDGNGRMSRLLTLLLLYRAGYIVGKYISIEKLIEISKDTYYEALQDSSKGWHEEKNDYEPFVKYMLGVVVNAYKDFSSRVWMLTTSNLSKPERVREVIRETLGTITKADILKKCPDISQITIQRALAEMVNKEEIIKIGGGRYTKYTWNWERDE